MWITSCEPVEEQGVRGLAVFIRDEPNTRWEVGRVAFVDSQSVNPELPFDDRLAKVIQRADEVAETLNDFEAEEQRAIDIAEQERVDKANRKIKEILGKPRQRKGME